MSKGSIFKLGLGIFLASILAFSGCKKKSEIPRGGVFGKKSDAEVAELIDKDIGVTKWGASLYGRGYGGSDYTRAKESEVCPYNHYNDKVEVLCNNAGWYLYFLECYREAGDSLRMLAYGDTTKNFLEKALATISSDTTKTRYNFTDKGDCKPAIGVVKCFLGQVHFYLGDDKLALKYFGEAQQFNDSIGYKEGVIKTIIHKGELLRERKKYKEALGEFGTALEICKNMWENQEKQKNVDNSWKKWTARCYEERSRTFRKMGDSENSLKDSRTAQELLESLERNSNEGAKIFITR